LWLLAGMDYPDVTMVIQVGLTEKEQYIHRLGRTARAGKGGCGILMCAPFEDRYLTRELKDLPISRVPFNGPTLSPQLSAKLSAAMRNREVLGDTGSCWAAWLGFYNSHLRKLSWSTDDLVANARVFSESMTLPDIPELEAKTVGKMGLKGVKGLRIMSKEDAMQRHMAKQPQKKAAQPPK
jgi:ATP-dependent RNA helicase MSS116